MRLDRDNRSSKVLCYFKLTVGGGCVVLGLHWPLGFCRVVVVLLEKSVDHAVLRRKEIVC